MFENMDEAKAKEYILSLVSEYASKYHAKKPFEPGGRVPYAARVYDDKELVSLVDCSLEFWLTAGRFTERFEDGLAKFLGVNYCALVNSGSSANLLALSALTSHKLGARRVKKGDEVITVAAGFPTTVNPIIQNGLVPVFVDCEIDTYNINADKIEEAITDKTKVIFLAHTLGSERNGIGI